MQFPNNGSIIYSKEVIYKIRGEKNDDTKQKNSTDTGILPR